MNKQTDFLHHISIWFMILVLGIMLGYGWRCYHENLEEKNFHASQHAEYMEKIKSYIPK